MHERHGYPRIFNTEPVPQAPAPKSLSCYASLKCGHAVGQSRTRLAVWHHL